MVDAFLGGFCSVCLFVFAFSWIFLGSLLGWLVGWLVGLKLLGFLDFWSLSCFMLLGFWWVVGLGGNSGGEAFSYFLGLFWLRF